MLSISFVWPQVVRVYRLRSVEGLSPTGTLHGVAATSLWTVYGASQGVVPLILSNVIVGFAMVLIGVAQVRHGVLAARMLAATAALATAVALMSTLVSPALTGWIAIAVGATSILPQTLHVLRSDDLSGVSVAMYGLLILTAAGWATYGALIGDLLVSAPNVLVLPCAVFIAVKAVRAQTGAGSEPLPVLASYSNV